MFVPQAKLLFCGVPKAGITEWLKFVQQTRGAKDCLSIPQFKHDVHPFFMNNLNFQALQLADPTWTKTMFIRNPAEQSLLHCSNKMLQSGNTCKHFHITNGTGGQCQKDKSNKSIEHHVLSFKEAVHAMSCDNSHNLSDPRGLHGKTDLHFRAQSMMCGMDCLLPCVDFVGNFGHVAEHAKMLLERIGLWDDCGSKFDPASDYVVDKTTDICVQPPPPARPANHTGDIGFDQRGP